MSQGFHGLAGEKDCVTCIFGELLDAGRDVDGVTDQRELKLAAAADSAGDHHTGIDSNADPKVPAESLGDEAINGRRCVHGGGGMIRQIVRCTEYGERAVAKELVDVPTGIDDGGD